MEDRIICRAGRLVLSANPRVRVEEILALRAAGHDAREIAACAPGLTEADIAACIAADRAIVYPPLAAVAPAA